MKFKIGKTLIGDNQPVYVVAELSCNHLQNYDLAVKTIKAMKASGADAVKLQTYTGDTITLDVNNKYFQIKGGTLWDGKTLHELYDKANTPWDWHLSLQKLTLKLGMDFFSTPQDETAVDFLVKMNTSAYKVASFEITHLPLIKYMAKQGKPMLIPTGLAKLEDIKKAIEVCHKVGNKKIVLLKCNSAYPTPLEELNLRTISDMKQRFPTIIGLSDHTLNHTSTLVSVALGAKVVEKHFILSRNIGGFDEKFSLEPTEFAQMVKEIRNIEKSLGKISYDLSPKSKLNMIFMRSIFVSKDIKKDEKFTKKNIRVVRPSYGLAPENFDKVLGKRATRNLKKGTPLKEKMFD